MCSLFASHHDEIVKQLKRQVDAKKKPPIKLDDLLNGLSKSVPKFVTNVRDYISTDVQVDSRNKAVLLGEFKQTT